jgi:Fe(3+) dicitrate transport protein
MPSGIRPAASAALFAAVSTLLAAAAAGQPTLGTASTEADTELEPVIVVIGRKINLETIPGSGMVLDQALLAESHVFTVNEAMRKVPGVFARDEEGFGLRPNLGIRGLNPTRSSKLLMLEDGIPLAFAPYGDNASYYHPPVNRFERIEVLKGSSQILFGPQTLGGLVNYITPAVPGDLAGRMDATVGSEDYREFHGQLGDTVGRTGYLLNGTWKESDGTRENMHFEVGDLNLKVVQQLTDRQALTLRGSYYDEDSQVTYTGLTLAEWQDDPRGNPFRNDHMYASRWGTSATHRFELDDDTTFLTNAYYTEYDRDWWRQASNSGQRPNDASDPACGGMANLDTTCGNEGRLRQYWTAGLEPRVNFNHTLFGVENLADAGIRYHQEHQYRVQANGDTPHAREPGTGSNAGIREDSDRDVTAWSGFLQNRFDFGRWTVTPGLRYEHVDYVRVDHLIGTRGTASVDEWIPGIGATVEPIRGTTVFAGVHRGFSPPGVADIITPAGGSVNLDPEYSWNYEVGVRSDLRDGLYAEATLFRLDFENQIVPASVAGGSGAALTSAGQTLQQGFELAGNADSTGFVDWPVEVFGRLSWTWLPTAEFEGLRYSSVAGFTSVVVTGNRLPYTPEQLFSGTIGVRAPFGLSVQLEGVYTSSAYTDDLNTVEVTPNGQRGEMPGYTIWNLSANLPLDAWNVNLFLTVKNLTDELYVVDMSRGLVPGMPRLVQGGFSIGF